MIVRIACLFIAIEVQDVANEWAQVLAGVR